MTFRLRRVHSQAGRQLVAMLDRELFADSPTIDLKELQSPDVVWWLAYADDAFVPIGFCGLWLPPKKWEASFTRAGVAQSHRRHGLQKQMIKTRITFARYWGYTTVETYVHGDNVASTRALLACGFVPHKASQNRKEGLWLHVTAPTSKKATR